MCMVYFYPSTIVKGQPHFYTQLNILWILVLIKTVRLFRYYRIRLNLNSPADNEDERDKKK